MADSSCRFQGTMGAPPSSHGGTEEPHYTDETKASHSFEISILSSNQENDDPKPLIDLVIVKVDGKVGKVVAVLSWWFEQSFALSWRLNCRGAPIILH